MAEARRDPSRKRKGARKEPPTLEGRAYDAAGDLPGPQLNDPDETAESGVHEHRIPPHRR